MRGSYTGGHPLTFEHGGVVRPVAVGFEGLAIRPNERLQGQIPQFYNP